MATLKGGKAKMTEGAKNDQTPWIYLGIACIIAMVAMIAIAALYRLFVGSISCVRVYEAISSICYRLKHKDYMPNMESTELLKNAVEEFQDKNDDWNENLEQFISHIASTGDTLVSWEKARKVFVKKLHRVLDEFFRVSPYSPGKINANAVNDDFDEMKTRLTQLAEEFDEPPFTIQRLCELLIEPMKNYKKCEKFMRGLEKNLMVVTSWNYPPRRASQGNDSMTNGISFGPSNGIPPSERVQPHWANLPPSPIATGPPKIPGAPDFTATTSKKDVMLPPNSSESDVEGSDKAAVPQQEGTKKEILDEQKSNISATIISSSPPITINIKRKIDESSDNDQEKSGSQPLVPQCPTKKLKFDEVEELPDSSNTQESSAEPSNDTAKEDCTATESKIDKSSDYKEAEVEKEVTEEIKPESQNKDGTPIDPTPTKDMEMEVD